MCGYMANEKIYAVYKDVFTFLGNMYDGCMYYFNILFMVHFNNLEFLFPLHYYTSYLKLPISIAQNNGIILLRRFRFLLIIG